MAQVALIVPIGDGINPGLRTTEAGSMGNVSEARINANRLNALRSTGPRTPEGKAIARGNALTHGLTGQGVVIPGEDAAEVDGRMAQLVRELAKDGSSANRLLAQRAAVLSVRLERSVRHEFAATAERVQQAEADYLAGRHDEAQRLFEAGPTRRAELLAWPEGVDLVLEALGDLRALAKDPTPGRWTEAKGLELTRCLGVVESELTGDDASIVERIDAEVAKLQTHRVTLDHQGVAAERAAAADRALVGDDPATLRARKYEAATERGLFRILKELRVAQEPEPIGPATQIPADLARNLAATRAELERLGATVAPPSPPIPPPSLGSFFPEPRPGVPATDLGLIRIGNPAPHGQSRYPDRKKRPRVPG